MKIKAIITGATGMVREGVSHECPKHPDVGKSLIHAAMHGYEKSILECRDTTQLSNR